MSKNSLLIGGIVLVSIGLLLFGLTQLQTETPQKTPVSMLPVTGDWVKGSPDAPIVLIEYSDFECPTCAAFYPIVKQLREELGKDLALVYRQFPLEQIHKNARQAAAAAEAAGLQNKFFEMHDLLFEKQVEWSKLTDASNLFVVYARELGLDTEQFRSDMLSNGVSDAITNDFDGGISLGINGTPTFFVNGEKINLPRTYEEFKSLVLEFKDK